MDDAGAAHATDLTHTHCYWLAETVAKTSFWVSTTRYTARAAQGARELRDWEEASNKDLPQAGTSFACIPKLQCVFIK